MKYWIWLAAAWLGSAHAQDLATLTKARNWVALEAAADARLAQDAVHADALVAKVNSILGSGEVKRYDLAVQVAEKCVAAHPQNSACHEALGSALGAKALNAGMMSAMGSAGRIRDAFKTAVALDAKNWSARLALMQFYLAAPSVVGGGKAKAAELAAETAKLHADAGQLMRAAMALSEKSASQAERALAAIAKLPHEDELRDQLQQLWAATIGQYIREKKFDDATRSVKALGTRFPNSEWVPYGQGRIAQEQGKFNEAIEWYRKALAIKNEAASYFRIAQCFEGLNEKSQAIAHFDKALALKSGLSKSQREEATERLKALRAT